MRGKVAFRYAFATLLTLVGGIFTGFVTGFVLFESLPGHLVEPARIGLSAAPALIGILGGGAAWGWMLARMARIQRKWPLMRAGVLGFSLPLVLAMMVLIGIESGLEWYLSSIGIGSPPIHRIFTLLFVPTSFLLAACGAGFVGRALGVNRLVRLLALRAGGSAALAFLVVNIAMDLLGWRVGAPGAAERFTMLTVMMLGNAGAALAGGAALGITLYHYLPAPSPQSKEQGSVEVRPA
jgi:hypothetical protein